MGLRPKLQFALCIALIHWLVADLRLISPLQRLLAGAGLLAYATMSHALVRRLYGARLICTPL